MGTTKKEKRQKSATHSLMNSASLSHELLERSGMFRPERALPPRASYRGNEYDSSRAIFEDKTGMERNKIEQILAEKANQDRVGPVSYPCDESECMGTENMPIFTHDVPDSKDFIPAGIVRGMHQSQTKEDYTKAEFRMVQSARDYMKTNKIEDPTGGLLSQICGVRHSDKSIFGTLWIHKKIIHILSVYDKLIRKHVSGETVSLLLGEGLTESEVKKIHAWLAYGYGKNVKIFTSADVDTYGYGENSNRDEGKRNEEDMKHALARLRRCSAIEVGTDFIALNLFHFICGAGTPSFSRFTLHGPFEKDPPISKIASTVNNLTNVTSLHLVENYDYNLKHMFTGLERNSKIGELVLQKVSRRFWQRTSALGFSGTSAKGLIDLMAECFPSLKVLEATDWDDVGFFVQFIEALKDSRGTGKFPKLRSLKVQTTQKADEESTYHAALSKLSGLGVVVTGSPTLERSKTRIRNDL